MNKEAKEYGALFLINIETKWLIIGGLAGGLLFNIGLYIGIVFGTLN